LYGPEFLWHPLDNETTTVDITDKDPEIVKGDQLTYVATVAQKPYLLSVIGTISSWLKIIQVTGFMLRFIFNTRLTRKKHSMKTRSQPSERIQPLNVSELENVKRKIIATLQQFEFSNTISRLRQKGKVDANDNIIKLDPFIHTDGLLRVGGRLQRSSMEFNLKHPIILPKIDLFCPFYIKVRRSLVKPYGVMYTCLASRAVHLENTQFRKSCDQPDGRGSSKRISLIC